MIKRILLLATLLIVLCLCSCQKRTSVSDVSELNINDTTAIVQVETISDKLIHDIESEYEKESKKDEYTTTVGMIDLAYKYANKWDAVSAEYYDKIITVVEDAFEDKKDIIIEQLDKLKESYDEYAENNLDLYTEIYNLIYSGGSIIGILCAREYYDLKKDYALELVGIYEKMTFDMKQ